MGLIVEAKVKRIDSNHGRGSVHIEIEGGGGITINNLLLLKDTDKIKVKIPLNKQRYPILTMQGELKQLVFGALEEEFKQI